MRCGRMAMAIVLARCSTPERVRSIADSGAVGSTHSTGCRARFRMFCSRGRRPPCLLQIADSRPLLAEAARSVARHGGGWMTAEALAAGFTYGRALWFGTERNVGRVLAAAADELGIAVDVIT